MTKTFGAFVKFEDINDFKLFFSSSNNKKNKIYDENKAGYISKTLFVDLTTRGNSIFPVYMRKINDTSILGFETDSFHYEYLKTKEFRKEIKKQIKVLKDFIKD